MVRIWQNVWRLNDVSQLEISVIVSFARNTKPNSRQKFEWTNSKNILLIKKVENKRFVSIFEESVVWTFFIEYWLITLKMKFLFTFPR